MIKKKKILFLHGFYASGSCIPAQALKEAFENNIKVLTPDIPLHPDEALRFIESICKTEKPDILVGNSCGSFYAQIIASKLGLPALLGNPHFEMTRFLKDRIGNQQYKAPRQDGKQDFIIDQTLIDEFAVLEKKQFLNVTEEGQEYIWGLFGQKDTLAHYEPLFLKYYSKSFHFLGGHTPTAEEVKTCYVPLIKLLLKESEH